MQAQSLQSAAAIHPWFLSVFFSDFLHLDTYAHNITFSKEKVCLWRFFHADRTAIP